MQCGQNVIFVNIESGGKVNNHWDLKHHRRQAQCSDHTNILYTTHCTVTRKACRHASLVHLVSYGLDKQREKNPLRSKANEVVWEAMAHMSERHLTT
jgi:hypothetical protein